MSQQLLRYEHVRRADSLDDQKSAASIAGANGSSVTQQDYQEFIISQLKRIIFGNNSGVWSSDFMTAGIQSLKYLTTIAGTGLTPSTHSTIRQLIHFISEGPAEGFASGAYKTTTGGVFPTLITWWESAAQLKRIYDKAISYNANKTPNTIQWQMYDTDGVTIIATVLDTISYSGVFETSRTRAIS